MKTNWFKNIFRKKDKEKESYVKIPEDIRMKIIKKCERCTCCND